MAGETENVVEQQLATLVRKGYGDKKDEQFRIELCSYAGKRYVSARLWWQADGGEWAPSKKGVSIRLSELDEFIAALNRAKAAGEQLPLPTGAKAAQRDYKHPQSGRSVAPKPDPVQADGTIADADVWS